MSDTQTQKYTHMNGHRHMHPYTHGHTCECTHTHTRTHTHTHTHTQTLYTPITTKSHDRLIIIRLIGLLKYAVTCSSLVINNYIKHLMSLVYTFDELGLINTTEHTIYH